MERGGILVTKEAGEKPAPDLKGLSENGKELRLYFKGNGSHQSFEQGTR